MLFFNANVQIINIWAKKTKKFREHKNGLMKYINYKTFWTTANKWPDYRITRKPSLLFKNTNGFQIHLCYIISRCDPNTPVPRVASSLKNHLFVTFAKFSKNVIFLTPLFIFLSYQGVWNVSISENFVKVINEWPLMTILLSPNWLQAQE